MEELIAKAQEEQSSQTSLIINEHRKRKGRRGGLEFKVQKVKKRSWGDEDVGGEYWQPEANLSQDKLTSYWEKQCGVANRVAKKNAGKEKDFKMTELDILASEGNHCRQKPKEVSSNVYQFEAVPQKYQNNVHVPFDSLKD